MASSSRAVAVAAVLVPVAAAAAYIYALNRRVSQHTTSSTGKLASISSVSNTPKSLPELSKDEVVAYERIERDPLPTHALLHPLASESTPFLTAYSRAVQSAFASSPQAWLIRRMIKEPDVQRTFDKDYIATLDFAVGDLVCGIWRVSYRSPTRVECIGDPPASYKGERVGALVISEVEERDGVVVIINETWMWRKANAKPTLIETPVGAWVHALIAKWLVWHGVRATTTK